ncbi:MAG: gamma-glutamyltransferase [Acidobacteria bacterium]|nr:MAG: gamma-glutamyltransferase [Acidobacteriota bacterium]
MPSTRRTFVRSATSGALATSLLGAGTASTAAARAGVSSTVDATGGTPGSVDPEERRRLIAKAVFGHKQPAEGKGGMVICAHPLATRAGTDVLRADGNAADAALAASVTQTVVEPHMTGITGVLSTLYFDAATGTTSYVNGGMNRPMAELKGWGPEATSTGLGCGVPGFWAGYEATRERFGSRPSRELCAAAIAYARDGFEVHPFLYGEMFTMASTLGQSEQGREIYFPGGALLDPGRMLYQRRAADTLERLVEEGNDYFYRGDFARRYCEVVQQAGGVMTPEDFERYDVRLDEPARGSYRGYELVGSPLPDHGGTHLIEILQMIELLDVGKLGPVTESPELLWQMARICQQVFADGGRHRDPKYHPVPLELIVSKQYARTRFELLQMDAPLEQTPSPAPGSCHVTAVDARGNVATILHSCMSLPWSNGLFTEGVAIFASGAHFFRVMPGPGERASVYVAPNMILKDGRPILASGSPSGSLLQNITQNVTNMLDHGMGIEESTNRPRFGTAYSAGGGMFLAAEADFPRATVDAVNERGLGMQIVNPANFGMGSFEAIWIDPETGVREACGDRRRCAMAEAV